LLEGEARSIAEAIDYSGIICRDTATRPDRFPGRGQFVGSRKLAWQPVGM